MKNNLGLKLIAVIDLNHLKLYEAQGLKILNELVDLALDVHKERRHEKNEGSFQKMSVPGTSFEPHTTVKDLEHQEATKIIVQHLDEILHKHNNYKEIMIVAEPKMLGYVRTKLSSNVKKLITKEIAKDLVHHDIPALEKIIFA